MSDPIQQPVTLCKTSLSSLFQPFSSCSIVPPLKLTGSTKSAAYKFFFHFTARNSSCGKVLFSQACVKNSVHGEGGMCGMHTPRHACPPQAWPPGNTRGYYEMRSMSGRYESYWNAFLFVFADSFMLQIVQDCEPLLNSFVMFVHDNFFFFNSVRFFCPNDE